AIPVGGSNVSDTDSEFQRQFSRMSRYVEMGDEETRFLAKQLQKLLNAAQNDEEVAMAQLLWAQSLLNDERLDEGKRRLQLALAASADKVRRAFIYDELAHCLRGLKDFDKALAAAEASLL